MISDLIKVLQGIGLNATAEDVADMLWLAWHLDEPVISDEKFGFGEQQRQKDHEEEITLETEPEAIHEPERPIQKEDETREPRADLYPHTSESEKDFESGPSMGGLPFRTPGGPALPGKLEISRALRPLMRKVPSRNREILDEDATVRNIADSDIWVPAMKPEPSRWLDVVLVVDESYSMIIWYETIFELKELLERQGAFRNVQMWGFYFDEVSKSVCLHTGASFDRGERKIRDPKELIDPTGRLILVISDCVSTAWHNGMVSEMFKVWNDNSRVTIVQMLPHYCGNGLV